MRNRETYDFVIVGGGSTGCVLAARLSEDGERSVLLLEAGPVPTSVDEFPDAVLDPSDFTATVAGHPVNWSLPGESRPGIQVAAPRGKFIGGSGSINGAYFTRARRTDFDRWESLGNPDWSFGHALRCYRRSETDRDFSGPMHGAEGPVSVRREPADRSPEFVAGFTAACVGLGYPREPDKNGEEPEGVGPVPLNIDCGRRVSTAISHLMPNLDRPNLVVRGDVLVRRVIFDRHRAVGVEAEEDGRAVRFDGAEVIVSAGALRSPQLLMLSGIGPAAQLRRQGIEVLQDAPGVGAGLVDHPDVVISYGLAPGAAGKRVVGAGGMTSALHWKVADGLGAASDGTVEVLPYVMTAAEGVGLEADPAGDADDPMVNYFMFTRLMQQHSRGAVTLASANPHDGPGLTWNFLEDGRDLAQYREVLTVVARIFDSPPMREIGGRLLDLGPADLSDEAALDDWIRGHLSTWGPGHATSTCRMGPPEDETAVVDQAGSVRGIEGLRVADTSIFPTITSRGTSATAVMAGERLAELIR